MPRSAVPQLETSMKTVKQKPAEAGLCVRIFCEGYNRAIFRFVRRLQPSKPRPANVIAQVAGSGTAAMKAWLSVSNALVLAQPPLQDAPITILSKYCKGSSIVTLRKNDAVCCPAA